GSKASSRAAYIFVEQTFSVKGVFPRNHAGFVHFSPTLLISCSQCDTSDATRQKGRNRRRDGGRRGTQKKPSRLLIRYSPRGLASRGRRFPLAQCRKNSRELSGASPVHSNVPVRWRLAMFNTDSRQCTLAPGALNR